MPASLKHVQGFSVLPLEPQCEVGGMADHAEQVGGVMLFVIPRPHTANQLRWLDCPKVDRKQNDHVRVQ